jgi:hypothetical protein
LAIISRRRDYVHAFFQEPEKTLGSLQMRIYAFEMTNKVVGRYYKLIKHCFIDIEFAGLGQNEIGGFNHQNAILALNFGKRDDFLFCELSHAFGVDGYIEAQNIRINSLQAIDHSRIR